MVNFANIGLAFMEGIKENWYVAPIAMGSSLFMCIIVYVLR